MARHLEVIEVVAELFSVKKRVVEVVVFISPSRVGILYVIAEIRCLEPSHPRLLGYAGLQ